MPTLLKSLVAAAALTLAFAAPAAARPDPEVIVRTAAIPGSHAIAYACEFHTVRSLVIRGSFTCDGKEGLGSANQSIVTGTKEAAADGSWQICWSYWVVYAVGGSAFDNTCLTGTI